MRRGERGYAFVWMLIVLLLVITATLGMAQVGRSSGDYVRRQVTADTSAESAAEILAERLRHVGRLQLRAKEALEDGDVEVAQRSSVAAWQVAIRTAEVVRAEAIQTAKRNGATKVKVQKVPASMEAWKEWFVQIPSEHEDIQWVGLAKNFKSGRIHVLVWHPNSDGSLLRAESAAWVERVGGWPTGALVEEDWRGRRTTIPASSSNQGD